jgi:hypothetical protein
MSRHYNLYIETCRTGVWNRPEEFAREKQPHYSHQKYGEFVWVSRHVDAETLFFGKRALFQFQRGRPPETEHSALFQYLDLYYDYEEDEGRLSWIPYQDLLVDLWDEMNLLVQAEVAPKYAAFFADGIQPFPEQAFVEAGLDEYRITAIRQGQIVNTPIDRSFGRGRYELAECPPDGTLAVTWKDSVRGQLGDWCVKAFGALRQYGSDDQSRVISLFL